MRKVSLIVGVLLAIVGTIYLVSVFWCYHGQFSHCNFQKIAAGMTLREVEAILGSPGIEVRESELPGIVDWDAPVDSPKRIKPVIAGEKYYRWEDGARYILVSLNNGAVREKNYWEPSF